MLYNIYRYNQYFGCFFIDIQVDLLKIRMANIKSILKKTKKDRKNKTTKKKVVRFLESPATFCTPEHQISVSSPTQSPITPESPEPSSIESPVLSKFKLIISKKIKNAVIQKRQKISDVKKSLEYKNVGVLNKTNNNTQIIKCNTKEKKLKNKNNISSQPEISNKLTYENGRNNNYNIYNMKGPTYETPKNISFTDDMPDVYRLYPSYNQSTKQTSNKYQQSFYVQRQQMTGLYTAKFYKAYKPIK